MTVVDAIKEAAYLVATDPQGAALRLEKAGDRLHELAAQLRNGNPWQVPGGIADRVKIKVIGPDGLVKQAVEVIG